MSERPGSILGVREKRFNCFAAVEEVAWGGLVRKGWNSRKRTHGMGRSGIGIFGVGGAGLARVRRRGGEQRGGASREHGLRMACDSIYLNIYTLISILHSVTSSIRTASKDRISTLEQRYARLDIVLRISIPPALTKSLLKR